MQINKLEGGIVYITGLIDDPDNLLKAVEEINLPWQKWNLPHIYCEDDSLDHFLATEDNENSGVRKKIHYSPGDEKLDYIVNTIDTALKKAVEEYCKITNLGIDEITKDYDIRKYLGRSKLHSHLDNNSNNGIYEDISLLFYFNDNYKGGEIYFSDLDLEIKPEAGSFLFFDGSKLWHETRQLEYGSKYYIPFFIINKKRIISTWY